MADVRVVSLIASATEIVCALGGRDSLVGVSHECDFPRDVSSLPVCSFAKVDASRPSNAIDRDIKTLLRDAVSIYGLNTDVIEELRPTHLITQSQCDVCAVSLSDVRAAVCETLRCDPEIVVCEPNSLADVYADIRRIGGSIGRASEAEVVVASMRTTIERPQVDARRPRVACVEWTEPLMAAGNWVPELVQAAGGENVLGIPGRHSPWMTAAELTASRPDVIVVMPCGFNLPRTVVESRVLANVEGWDNLPAVRTGQVYAVDGNAYFNRPGPRLAESTEILRELAAGPKGGGDGSRWQRLTLPMSDPRP